MCHCCCECFTVWLLLSWDTVTWALTSFAFKISLQQWQDTKPKWVMKFITLVQQTVCRLLRHRDVTCRYFTGQIKSNQRNRKEKWSQMFWLCIKKSEAWLVFYFNITQTILNNVKDYTDNSSIHNRWFYYFNSRIQISRVKPKSDNFLLIYLSSM